VPPSPRRTTLLVVEDDPALRGLYRAVLVGAGYVVIPVEDGIDALRRIEADAPSAIVLDLTLPRLGGLDVHREITAHADTRHIPIIVVTANDTSGLDPNDFACILKKPVDPDALLRAVENCLRSKVR
jgi:two-component system, OmpR family, phosphate regulon response regulator PhoB